MTWANLDWQPVLCCVPNQIGFNTKKKKKSSGDDNVFKEKKKNMRLESLTWLNSLSQVNLIIWLKKLEKNKK
jgi:hypothetical protein